VVTAVNAWMHWCKIENKNDLQVENKVIIVG
jgi:hypothetical protein